MTGRGSAPPPPGLEELARAALVDALGTGVRIERVDPVQSAETSTVLRLSLAAPPRHVVFKATRRGAAEGTDYARTAAVVDLARAAGAPVAAVLASDTSERSAPWQYLLQEHVPGTEWRRVRPLLGADEVSAVHASIAEAVLAIQTVRFDGYGELDRRARPAGRTLLDAVRGRARGRIVDRRRRQVFLDLLEQHADLFCDRPGAATLCHDDLHHGNVVLDRRDGRWRVAGLLDWDKAWAGPAESDPARMGFWDDMTGPASWRTYRAAVPAEPGSEQRALIYQLLWCLEYDVATARHATDTRTLLRRLGADPAAAG